MRTNAADGFKSLKRQGTVIITEIIPGLEKRVKAVEDKQNVISYQIRAESNRQLKFILLFVVGSLLTGLLTVFVYMDEIKDKITDRETKKTEAVQSKIHSIEKEILKLNIKIDTVNRR